MDPETWHFGSSPSQSYMFATSAVPTAETAQHGIKWGLISYLTQKYRGNKKMRHEGVQQCRQHSNLELSKFKSEI
jgi:hypothetical protein